MPIMSPPRRGCAASRAARSPIRTGRRSPGPMRGSASWPRSTIGTVTLRPLYTPGHTDNRSLLSGRRQGAHRRRAADRRLRADRFPGRLPGDALPIGARQVVQPARRVPSSIPGTTIRGGGRAASARSGAAMPGSAAAEAPRSSQRSWPRSTCLIRRRSTSPCRPTGAAARSPNAHRSGNPQACQPFLFLSCSGSARLFALFALYRLNRSDPPRSIEWIFIFAELCELPASSGRRGPRPRAARPDGARARLTGAAPSG